MGRGNVCTFGQYEGLYYLDYNFINAYRKVIRCKRGHVTGFDFNEVSKTANELDSIGVEYDYDGKNADWRYDEITSRDNWRFMIETMQEILTRRFKSFYIVDKLRDRDKHIVLENNFFQIAVVDNEWSAAWCLLEHPDIDNQESSRSLMNRYYERYLDGIKAALIELWGEAIGYGGCWTSGVRYTKDAA
jgi:hypothetical protein